jgi:hypothetical protein
MVMAHDEEGAAMPAAGNAGHPQPGAPVATPAAPALHEPKRCRSCGAAVLWCQLIDKSGDIIRHEDGPKKGRPKAIPVDFEPVANGNVQVADRGGAIVARVLGPRDVAELRAKAEALRTDPRLRLNHFVTCPNADEHRRTP